VLSAVGVVVMSRRLPAPGVVPAPALERELATLPLVADAA
jgi:hypothetical protein